MSQGRRRLAAIMFTDMVGYTALGQKSEPLSLALLREQEKLIRPILRRHNGREVKTMGDAFLVEFPNALDAVRCAYDIQRASREYNFSQPNDKRIKLRVGLHVGDVEASKGDLFGDAVNVASRIEPLAEDGGVCITRQVHDNVQNKFELPLVSLGPKILDNVSIPVEVFRIVMPWEKEKTASWGLLNPRRIAVMPFANVSPDPGDEYFADGMTDELISTMSKIEQFEVISRTSMMQFKKNPKPIKEVSRDLDAGTVLEGSVRKSGNKLRVTVEMIDGTKDRHVWSESYDRELKDIFSIQTEISKAVAEELKVRIVPSEMAKLDKKSTANTEAYTLYLKGRYYWNERTKAGVLKAIQCFSEAMKRDPDFARAYAGLADCYMIQELWGYMPPAEAHEKRKTYAAKALEIDSSLSEARVALAWSLASTEWDIVEAEQEFKRAIKLNPNYATAHHVYGHVLLGPQGRYDEAILELKEAVRLDPLSPMISINLGDQLLAKGQTREAENQYRNALETAPDFAYVHSRLGLALLKESRYDEAIAAIEKAMSRLEQPEVVMPDLIYAYWVVGRKDDARQLLATLESKSAREYVSNVSLAQANAAVGMKERAIELLFKAAAERSSILQQSMIEPQFDQLRSDPRFQNLLKAMGMRQES